MNPDSIDFYKSLLDNLHDGVYFVDRERRITYWNKGAERLTGYAAHEVVGSCCWDNILCHVTETGLNLCTSACPLMETMTCRQPRQADVFLKHKEGHRLPVQVRVAPLVDQGGTVIGAVEIFSDNTPQTRLAHEVQRLEQLASLDKLTEVANRRYGEITIANRIEEMKRHGWGFGLLFLDIDDFKQVNDTFGHDAGDAVLKMVARTLQSNVRAYDTVARWGGEEFVVILTQITTAQIGMVAEKLRTLIAADGITLDQLPPKTMKGGNVKLGGAHTTVQVKVMAPFGKDSIVKQGQLRVTVSIGAAMAQPGDTMETLVTRADALMYEGKKSGKNKVIV